MSILYKMTFFFSSFQLSLGFRGYFTQIKVELQRGKIYLLVGNLFEPYHEMLALVKQPFCHREDNELFRMNGSFVYFPSKGCDLIIFVIFQPNRLFCPQIKQMKGGEKTAQLKTYFTYERSAVSGGCFLQVQIPSSCADKAASCKCHLINLLQANDPDHDSPSFFFCYKNVTLTIQGIGFGSGNKSCVHFNYFNNDGKNCLLVMKMFKGGAISDIKGFMAQGNGKNFERRLIFMCELNVQDLVTVSKGKTTVGSKSGLFGEVKSTCQPAVCFAVVKYQMKVLDGGEKHSHNI
ncbi:hypothetical protein EGR_09185 [Echinococcus granulosus]|uniref:DUF5727 domain-containing protein n=1 Tax=Echinococcus granulosus TaxID=6210 RepID=W6U4B7_ECHGR|nr:hypothetical protein EGR_09185 [Echinococcus granulosus]EUB55938.1 hypothetical protein EGR_09185 [Echinococcus granulosus]